VGRGHGVRKKPQSVKGGRDRGRGGKKKGGSKNLSKEKGVTGEMIRGVQKKREKGWEKRRTRKVGVGKDGSQKQKRGAGHLSRRNE